MDDAMLEVMTRARHATMNGQYQDALRDYQWLHANAPDPLRLSYGVGGWSRLAEVYPPALADLTATRDRYVASLMDGSGAVELFHDVVAINRALEQHDNTHALFAHLDREAPKSAAAVASRARPALVLCGAYSLARRYLPDLDDYLAERAGILETATQGHEDLAPFQGTPRPYAEVTSYAADARLVIDILNGCGEVEAAAKTRQTALDLVSSPTWRARIAAEIDAPGTTIKLMSALREQSGE